MSNYLSRKKVLMGKNYEIELKLEQYGGAIVRVHAVPDMLMARIEDRTGYKLEDAIAALSSQDLSDEEIETLKAGAQGPGPEKEASPETSKEPSPSPELVQKAAKAIEPKLVLFLGELCKAGIVPDPDCKCKGKGCEECDVAAMVEDFRGFTVLMVGMAIIGASTASWQEVESFFSRPKAPSGPE